jgi:hypothetical protein
MDWLTTIPQIVGAISNLSATILQSLAQWLLTIILAGFIIGGVIVFALTGFAWLWIKRAVGELHPAPSAVRH